MELVVRDGRFFTIGDNGAEFFQYKQNDIVFNAAQTESLFKYGGIKGAKPRGTMLAGGTAFANGNTQISGKAFPWSATGSESGFAKKRKNGTSKTFNYDNPNVYNNDVTRADTKKNKNKSKDTKDDFEETFDWIEVLIARVEEAMDRLDQKINRTYKTWSSRNNAIDSQLSLVTDAIEVQRAAYNGYIAEANSVGLSKTWKTKVKNGKVDISTVKDEALAEKIKEYQTWYEKAIECKDAIQDLKDKEAELYMQKFDNVSAKYDGILQGYEHTETMLNEYISQAEAKGHIVSGKYYDELAKNEKNNIAKLKKEQAALIDARDEAVDSGVIKKYSEDWYNMCAEIDGVTQAIEEGKTALIEYAKSAEEANRALYELTQNRFSNVVDEADFLVDLLSYEDLHNDNGKLTNEGIATMGLHAQNQNTYMYKADEAAVEAARLKKQLDEDPYDTETEEAYYDAIKEQYDYILKAKEEEQSMIDLIKEGIDIELSALEDRIDKYEESLDSAKD